MKRVLACALLAGCATATPPRMRLVSSSATQATWAFVVEDRGGSAQLLIDGRPRVTGCERAGVTLRCELRGLFPGGHTVELHLAGAVLRRSVVVGNPLPRRPLLVRARDRATVAQAGQMGADGIVVPALETTALEELVEAGHKASLRVFAEAPAAGELVARHALDGVLGEPLPAGTARRFPEARALWVDRTASASIARGVLAPGDGLVETTGLRGAALAVASGRAAIVDLAALPLLDARRHHKALREGTATVELEEETHRVVRLVSGSDVVTLDVDGVDVAIVVAPPKGDGHIY